MRLPALLQNLLLSAASATVVAGAAEGVCRLLERDRLPVHEIAANWSDWDGEFYTAKGWQPSVDYNRDGLRDREHALAKPPGARRLVVLGDSTTFGQHLSAREAYTRVLQETLDARGLAVEVFNVALPGWSARQELIAYRRICRKYGPDQVLLAICLNDVTDMENNLRQPPALLAWLYRGSALVRRAVDAEGREIQDVRELFEQSDSRRVRRGFELLFGDIRTLRDEVRADGASFGVLVFPYRFQLAADAPPPRAQQTIAGFCEAQRIPFLDLLPAFHDAGAGIFVDEDHFTAAGAQLVANQLLLSGLVAESAPARPGLPGDLDSLVRLLDAPDAGRRAAAVSALATKGPEAKRAAGALVRRLNDASEDVRLRAAEALARIAPDAKACVPALVPLVADRAAPGRAVAARVLGEFGPAALEAVPALAEALRDPQERVRWQAAWALGEVGPGAGAAVPALIEATRDPVVRWRTVEALGKIGPVAAAAVPVLSAMLGDASGDMRRLAAWALDGIGPAAGSAAGALARLLSDSRADVRIAAVRALASVDADPRTAGPALNRALVDPDESVRREVIRALRKLRHRTAA